MRYQSISLGLSLCVALFVATVPAALAAGATDLAGSGWVSRDKSGGIMQLMEFRKDGTFVDMTYQHIYTGSWKQEGGSITAAVKYLNGTTSAGMENDEYIMYLADVVDGRLKGTSAHYRELERERFWEWSKRREGRARIFTSFSMSFTAPCTQTAGSSLYHAYNFPCPMRSFIRRGKKRGCSRRQKNCHLANSIHAMAILCRLSFP